MLINILHGQVVMYVCIRFTSHMTCNRSIISETDICNYFSVYSQLLAMALTMGIEATTQMYSTYS
jgi:hypothetical protein